MTLQQLKYAVAETVAIKKKYKSENTKMCYPMLSMFAIPTYGLCKNCILRHILTHA